VFVQSYPNRPLPVVKGYVTGDTTEDPDFKALLDRGLDEAILIYKGILKRPQVSSRGGYPDSVGDGRFRIQRKLVQAQAQRQTQQQALASYQALLKEALALDQRLNQFPKAETDNSWQVWKEMQIYLDPQKDAAYIQETEQSLKNAKLKAYR
jgi:hypothetical protein